MHLTSLISHSIPDRPWEKIGGDNFTVDNKAYLCTVDYYSSYFEVHRLNEKSTADITKKLRRHFAAHGIPNTVVSDNSPFNSSEFKQFSKSYEFEHVTSSPTYPQSNGKVENLIKTEKRLMKKANILDLRNTPTEGMGSSPAQRMFGRRTRSLLPMAKSSLRPKITGGVKKKLHARKEKQVRYYNRNTKELPPLRTGDTVRVYPRAVIKRRNGSKHKLRDKSTSVHTKFEPIEEGHVYTKNRRHLRIRKEPFNQQQPTDVENTTDL